MSSVKSFFIAPGQFLLGFVGWLIVSIVIILAILIPIDLVYETIAYVVSFVVQLIGLGLIFLAFHRNLRWIGIGIICALFLYLIGIFLQGSCGLPGLPFPLSVGMC